MACLKNGVRNDSVINWLRFLCVDLFSMQCCDYKEVPPLLHMCVKALRLKVVWIIFLNLLCCIKVLKPYNKKQMQITIECHYLLSALKKGCHLTENEKGFLSFVRFNWIVGNCSIKSMPNILIPNSKEFNNKR